MPDGPTPDGPSASPRAPSESLRRAHRPHLVGVAGAAMRSMAALLLAQGKAVSGSDSGSPAEIEVLRGLGIQAVYGHQAENVSGADLVIASAAVPPENPELAAARALGLPILSHAQALGALMADCDGIGVAGTHGKSTTTALVAHLLAVAGLDPTLAGGADALDFGGYARLGQGPHLVAEADEFGRRFLELHPRLAIITAAEPDHLDYYGSFEALLAAFQQFVAGMPDDGIIITCEDEPNLAGLLLPRHRIRYGWAGHAHWRLERYVPRYGGGAQFTVRRPDGSRESYDMRLNGRHNAANAVSALAVAWELGLPASAIRQGLATFQGTRRRFETLAQRNGTWVVEDYAHHPTAIIANLNAARDVHSGRLVAVFQPHTTHRTHSLLEEFAAAFRAADRVIVAPVYQPSGRGEDSILVTSADLVTRMGHPEAVAAESLEQTFALASEELQPGTLVLVLGAGDITTVARRLAQHVNGPVAAVAATSTMDAPR